MTVSRLAYTLLLAGLLAATSGCCHIATPTAAGDGSVHGRTNPEARPAPVEKPAQAVIYFDYRQSELDDADIAALAGWVSYLKAHPDAKALLEGHGDERGSPAINLELGEYRAAAVRAYLMHAGVPLRQLSIKSYGESRPVAKGDDETAWAMNRRVEIVLN